MRRTSRPVIRPATNPNPPPIFVQQERFERALPFLAIGVTLIYGFIAGFVIAKVFFNGSS